jgi:hypothetical protein
MKYPLSRNCFVDHGVKLAIQPGAMSVNPANQQVITKRRMIERDPGRNKESGHPSTFEPINAHFCLKRW